MGLVIKILVFYLIEIFVKESPGEQQKLLSYDYGYVLDLKRLNSCFLKFSKKKQYLLYVINKNCNLKSHYRTYFHIGDYKSTRTPLIKLAALCQL